MNAAIRERRADVEALGLALIDVKYGGRHARLEVRAPDGRTKTLFASHSPSHRWTQQRFRDDLKRFLEGRRP